MKVPKSLSSAKGCSSVGFLVCHVCQKFGVNNQFVPIAGPQCDLPSGKECQPETEPIEVAPCDDWPVGEMELNSVNNSVETDGKWG